MCNNTHSYTLSLSRALSAFNAIICFDCKCVWCFLGAFFSLWFHILWLALCTSWVFHGSVWLCCAWFAFCHVCVHFPSLAFVLHFHFALWSMAVCLLHAALVFRAFTRFRLVHLFVDLLSFHLFYFMHNFFSVSSSIFFHFFDPKRNYVWLANLRKMCTRCRYFIFIFLVFSPAQTIGIYRCNLDSIFLWLALARCSFRFPRFVSVYTFLFVSCDCFAG